VQLFIGLLNSAIWQTHTTLNNHAIWKQLTRVTTLNNQSYFRYRYSFLFYIIMIIYIYFTWHNKYLDSKNKYKISFRDTATTVAVSLNDMMGNYWMMHMGNYCCCVSDTATVVAVSETQQLFVDKNCQQMLTIFVNIFKLQFFTKFWILWQNLGNIQSLGLKFSRKFPWNIDKIIGAATLPICNVLRIWNYTTVPVPHQK